MITISNSNDFVFTPQEQAQIRSAADGFELEIVITRKNPRDGGNDTLYDFYDENENYLFSFDRDGGVIFSA